MYRFAATIRQTKELREIIEGESQPPYMQPWNKNDFFY